MKNNHFIYLILLLFVLFASCKKGIDTIAVDSTVYLPQSGLNAQTVLLGESIYELGVYKAGINQANPAVTVHMKIDLDAFNAFLVLNPGYVLLPETYYSIVSPSVVIPKDKERESYKIHLKGIDESFVSKKYVLPVTIDSVSPSVKILAGKSTVFLNFSNYRNVYECKYKAYGKVTLDGQTDPSAIIDEQIVATTVSANTISVKGAENDMVLYLTVQNNGVIINGAPSSAGYLIKNTTGKTSTYTGDFTPTYQASKGVFELYYSYMLNGQQKNVEVELKFWL
jgi:hypothetical protein